MGKGKILIGRPARVYTDQLVDDTGLRVDDIPVAQLAMTERVGWRQRNHRQRIKRIRDIST